jgi:hypothetical protein
MLWRHSSVVDANIVNQAGPETTWFKILAYADKHKAYDNSKQQKS